jgi:beta-galactosidase
MISPKLPGILYGADYNPEQWPPELWPEDMRLMKQAGVNLVSIGIFSWSMLQPRENVFCFDWLDELMDLLAEHGIFANLATATASQPAWLSRAYPEVLPADEYGRRLSYGSRQSYCPNSPEYRRLAAKLVRALAERYGSHPMLAMWHVNNEYGCHNHSCFCETCARSFIRWLGKRYGSVEALNEAWGTGFWSQTYYAWEEILPPRTTTAQKNPGQVLDYRRFMSDSLLECFTAERDILRELTPAIPITTNFPPDFKSLDLWRWAREMDFVSWDSYPDPGPKTHPSEAAFGHDLMRGLKGGRPFVLMEQAPSQVNWRHTNTNKRPGVMRLWSYQALGRGAEGIMFFQWRQSLKGAEKFHSAVLNHGGGESTRVFREVAGLGKELEGLRELVGARSAAEAAMIFDYENWWAAEYRPGPSAELHYLEEVKRYYRALFELNIAVDILHCQADLAPYRLLVAPHLYMLKPGLAGRIEQFVARGGIFLTTFFSGIADESDGIFPGGYPGPLSRVLGLAVEELDALNPGMDNSLTVTSGSGLPPGEYSCDLWCDVVRLDSAEALAVFARDYYAGGPALTENRYGKGRAFYLATRPERGFLKKLAHHLCQAAGIAPMVRVPEGVELLSRLKGEYEYLFVLNHSDLEVELECEPDRLQVLLPAGASEPPRSIAPKELLILKRKGPVRAN